MKKEAEFHYSREERLSQPGAPKFRVPRKGTLFKRNRSLLILLLDVLLIATIFILYRQFFFSPPHEGEMAGYELLLRAFPVKDRVIVNLRISGVGREAGKTDEPLPDRVFVRFMLADEELRLSELLPSAKRSSGALNGESVEVAGTLFFDLSSIKGKPPELIAEVQIGDEREVLRRKLE